MEKSYANDGKLSGDGSLSRKVVHTRLSRKTETEKPFLLMAPAEHLDEARNALADGYKLDTDPTKTVWGRVGDAKKHLGAIKAGSSQYIAAQGLMHKAISREKHIKYICTNVANQLMIKQREMLANELEQYYLNKGMFIDIELGGPDKASIKLMCPLFRETSIERIVDETNFFVHLKKAGFNKAVLGDNEGNVWTYRLNKS
ncbi:MAG: hypothetical protein NT178_08610 [Proteobacteria bacterium]|nr:hypothetical protein [Pseudomonadota bacterium]